MIDDKKAGFKLDWVMAIFSTALWLKVILMLEQTSLFGPTLRIITLMLQQLSIFLIFWFLELVAWSAFGILLFGQLKPFSKMEDSFFTLFGASFGSWDFEIFEKLPSE